MTRAILANIFLISHIFSIFHLPRDLWNKLQIIKNSENFHILHSAPCYKNYLLQLRTCSKNMINGEEWSATAKDIFEFQVMNEVCSELHYTTYETSLSTLTKRFYLPLGTIHLWRPHGRGVVESWNLSRICRFYCF